jgi:hypothetical protein
MTRFRDGLSHCIAAAFVASQAAMIVACAACPVRAADSATIGGLLLLDAAQVLQATDYSKKYISDYFNPTYGLIALGLGAIFGLAWLLGGEPVARLRGDPVPRRVRSRLDRLDATRLTVLAGIRAARASQPEPDLVEPKALYERLAGEIDEVIDKVRRDLLLNFVDEAYLVPALDALCDRARALSSRLRRIAPARSVAGDDGTGLTPSRGLLARVDRGWERAVTAELPKMPTLRQIDEMRWPVWSRIAAAPRRIS